MGALVEHGRLPMRARPGVNMQLGLDMAIGAAIIIERIGSVNVAQGASPAHPRLEQPPFCEFAGRFAPAPPISGTLPVPLKPLRQVSQYY